MAGSRIPVDEWHHEMYGLIRSFGLRSLHSSCPRCRRPGILVSRWVKGIPVKPMHVMHRRNGSVSRACLLSEDQASKVREKVDISKADIRKLLTRAKGFLLFSGGMDSLATLLYLRQISNGARSNMTAVYADTTVGFPEVTTYVKRMCARMDVPLKIVRPKKDYFELVRKKGIPTFKSRWCCDELKIGPIRKYLSSVTGPKVVFDGIRAAESRVRRMYIPIWRHPTFQCLSVSPIFRWSDERVERYVSKSGVPECPGKKLGCSSECWCGAYKRKSDFLKLLEIHPDIYKKLARVEQRNRNGFTFLYEKGQRISLRELARSASSTR